MFDQNTYYSVEAKPGEGQGLQVHGRRVLATFKGAPDTDGEMAANFAAIHGAEVYTIPEAEYWDLTYRIEEEQVIVTTEHPTISGRYYSHLLPTGRVVFEGPETVNLYDNFFNFQAHLDDDSDDFGLMVSVSRSEGQELTVTGGGFLLR